MVKNVKKRVAADIAATNPDEEQACRFPVAQKLSPVTPGITNQVAIEGFDLDDNMSADADADDDLDDTAVAQVWHCHFRRMFGRCALHVGPSNSLASTSTCARSTGAVCQLGWLVAIPTRLLFDNNLLSMSAVACAGLAKRCHTGGQGVADFRF